MAALSRLKHLDRFHQALPHAVKRGVQFRDFVTSLTLKLRNIQVTQAELVSNRRQPIDRTGDKVNQHRVYGEEHEGKDHSQRRHEHYECALSPLDRKPHRSGNDLCCENVVDFPSKAVIGPIFIDQSTGSVVGSVVTLHASLPDLHWTRDIQGSSGWRIAFPN